MEEITSSQQAKQVCGYPDKWQQAPLETELIPYPENSPRAIGDDKCNERRPDDKYTCRCTNLEDDQCNSKCSSQMSRLRYSLLNLCWTSTTMSTKAVPNESQNDLRMYQITYQTTSQVSHQSASRDVITKWPLDRQSPNGIMRDSWDNNWEIMTEHSDKDDTQITLNWDWIRGPSVALYQRNQLGCLPHGLPNWMMNDQTGGL